MLVEVIAGGSRGTQTLTNATGEYRLELSIGSTLLRWTRRGFETIESTAVVIGGQTVTLDQNLRPHWTVTGVVTGHDGRPVENTSLALFVESNFRSYSAWGSSDSAGRFTLVAHVFADDGWVRAERHGYINEQAAFTCRNAEITPFLCDGQTELRVDVRLTRIVRLSLVAPRSLRVGQTLEVRREIELDDGRLLVDGGPNPALSEDDGVWSTDDSIARVVSGAGPRTVTGVAPGNVTLRTRFSWVYADLALRVEP